MRQVLRDPRIEPAVGDVLRPSARLVFAATYTGRSGQVVADRGAEITLEPDRWEAEVVAVDLVEVRVDVCARGKGAARGRIYRGQRVPRSLWARLMVGAEVLDRAA